MTKDEALRMALEALETELCIDWTNNDEFNESAEKMHEAITAIKAVLAQPEQDIPKIGCVNHDCDKCKAQPEQEPVAWGMQNDDGQIYDCITPEEHAREEGEYTTPLYTTPPQRKPLTDEQRNWIVATCPTPRHIIDTVEKMHGIKEDT